MTRLTTIRPEFVEFVPKELEEGVLYISIPYSTTVHQCACGCGSKIALPIRPVRWRFTYDGETVSLCPSVGNWSFPCQSHYWIKRNRIEWAPKWSREKIRAARARDKTERDTYALDARGQSDIEEPKSVVVRLLQRARALWRK
jgi:Family of unknown function (DUF6527)